MKKFKAGLFGLGVVGSGVYQAIRADGNFPVSISKIAVKNPDKERGFSVDKNIIYTEAKDLLDDDSLELIIELINDPHEAFEIVSQALSKGKVVVTANKKMVSIYHQKLLKLQKENDTVLLYEAAVCGSIPILRLLDQQFKADEINKISTIANGTCNYILTQMTSKGWTYQKALKEAQALGFAELDPYSDVSGEDARFKLGILILHSFGIFIDAEQIPMVGVQQVSQQAINFASKIGAKIKLIGEAALRSGHLTASVMPHFVEPDEDIFHVEEEFNAVQLDAKYAKRQFFKGKGAGSLPTSSAVLSNLLDSCRNLYYLFPAQLKVVSQTAEDVGYFYVPAEVNLLQSMHSAEVIYRGEGHTVVRASFAEVIKTLDQGQPFTVIKFPESLVKKLPDTHVLI